MQTKRPNLTLCLMAILSALLLTGCCSAGGICESAPVRVAVYADRGAFGGSVKQTAASLDGSFAVTELMGENVRQGALSAQQVFVSPGGGASIQSRSLGPDGMEKLKKFVHDGGGFVGICAGAYLAAQNNPLPLAIVAARMPSPKWDRGVAHLKIELTPAGQKFFGETERFFTMRYFNGPVLTPDPDCGIEPYEVLAYFREEIAENGTPVGVQKDTAAITLSRYGKGRVVLFSAHPESSGLEHWLRRAVRYAAGEDE